MSDWDTTDLCLDRDLQAREEQAISWCAPRADAKHWRDLAKEDIGTKLRQGMKEQELATDADNVLDLIANPEELKMVAVFYTLYLIANSKITMIGDQSYFEAKANHYLQMFDKEWAAAVGMLDFDTDEDGEIGDSEKYNIPTGVKIVRGA